MNPREFHPRIEVDAVYNAGDVPEPRRLRIGHALYEVVEIVDRWYEGPRRAGGLVRHYFKVQTRSGSRFLLVHDVTADRWRLVRAFGPELPPGASGSDRSDRTRGGGPEGESGGGADPGETNRPGE